MVIVIAAWLIFGLLLLGTAAVVWLGIDTVVRGYQLWEQRNQDREENR
ncbi:MAG: hypothetical protein JWO11_3562 [Nocardioides sp.]|nr:hypothetical protein [Nocardioides sp.]